MQKTLTVNGKRFTAKQITKLPFVNCVGGDYCTRLNGKNFYWNYRKIQDCYYASVINKQEADAIALMPEDGAFRYSIWLSL